MAQLELVHAALELRERAERHPHRPALAADEARVELAGELPVVRVEGRVALGVVAALRAGVHARAGEQACGKMGTQCAVLNMSSLCCSRTRGG